MKKSLLILVVILLTLTTLSCSKSDTFNYSNPYLPYNRVNISKSLNLLPNLLHPMGSEIVDYNQGVGGVFIFNTGTGLVAYDLACPNHKFERCSIMEIKGNIGKCKCPEDGSVYNLSTGTSETSQYPLIPYRVEIINNMVYVTNF